MRSRLCKICGTSEDMDEEGVYDLCYGCWVEEQNQKLNEEANND